MEWVVYWIGAAVAHFLIYVWYTLFVVPGNKVARISIVSEKGLDPIRPRRRKGSGLPFLIPSAHRSI